MHHTLQLIVCFIVIIVIYLFPLGLRIGIPEFSLSLPEQLSHGIFSVSVLTSTYLPNI